MTVTNSRPSNGLIGRWAKALAFTFLGGFWLTSRVSAQQGTQPLVAIHDSEFTRALSSLPVVAPTPNTSGTQWWETDWNYFVMPDSLKEALTSDGTAFTVIGDSNISSGLLLPNGAPKYPIVFSLSTESIATSEIAQLTNYVAAGGFLFVSGPAFTRDTNGVSLGDFAIGKQMGIHMVVSGLTNWAYDWTLTRQFPHTLVSHIPDGTNTWRLPAYSEEINWGVSPVHSYTNGHDAWQINASDATVVAMGDVYPYLTVKPYGKGYFIYEAAFNPLVSHGGFGPGMYQYVILRNAIQWAFTSANLPVMKLSPWPYQYDAAFMIRHDLEDYANEMADIVLSAGVEYTNGVKGDYYMCTGTVRQDMVGLGYNTNTVIQSFKTAMTSYGATISSHNGGLKNANNLGLTNLSYDYWHWGTDEALDTTPAGYANGTAYSTASLSNSLTDIESWLPGLMKPSLRTWVACNFNATREASYNMQAQLGLKIIGDQKISPFPHWTLSTQTPDKKYAMLTEPVSEWFVGGALAQSLEPWHPPGVQNSASLHTSIDFYYNLGTLVNFYSHTLSTGEGDAGPLTPDYLTYCVNTNIHPRLWYTNGIGIYEWWLTRSNAQISVSFTTNSTQSIATYSIKGATDPNTAIELLTPGELGFCGLTITTNGVSAGTNAYRIVNNALIRLKVGASVTNAVISYNLQVPGAQVFSQNFSSVTPPSLPTGWTTFSSGAGVNWVTQSTNVDSISPYALTVPDVTNAGLSTVVSPQITLPSGTSQLSFRHNYNLDPDSGWSGFDGGTLEIKIGTNAFMDIVAAGGVFRAGGYTGSMATNSGSPIGGQKAWTWSSDGFTTTVVDLPPASVGQTVQFEWVFGTDIGNGTNLFLTGWQISDVAVTNLACGSCGGGTNAPVLQQGMGIQNVNEGLTITVTNTATDANPPPHIEFYTLIVAPSGAQIDGNGIITWTPMQTQSPSTNTFTTVVTNCSGLSATNSFKIVVNEVNSAPVLPTQNSLTNNELVPMTVVNTATESNIHATITGYTLINPPATASISPSGVITWTPSQTQSPGTYTFTTVVANNDPFDTVNPVLMTTNHFNVTVREINVAPQLSGQNNVTIPGGTLLLVTNSATEPNIHATTTSYTLINPPTGMSISNNGVITWIPDPNQASSSNLITTVVVNNDPYDLVNPNLSTTNHFTVKVTNNVTCQYASFFSQNFDGVTAPALPAGWTTISTNGESNWMTTTVSNNTAPNAVFVPDVPSVGLSQLISPTIAVPAGTSQLTFKNNYNLEIDSTNSNDGYDGGVLEIKIGTNAFTDIVAAGGNFISGGYNAVINTTYSNPLAGRSAWSGNSGGYITTTVGLPSAAAGQSIQLRWSCGTDNSNAKVGWWIDSISLSNLVCEANGPQFATTPGNMIIGEFSSIDVTNAATDAGAPPLILSYQLISPPSGANINSNGVITWAPTQSQSPGVYTFTTLASDNSQPTNLTASNSFTVTVKEINAAPTPPNIGAQSVNELVPLSVNDAATETNIHATITGYGLVNPLPGMNVTSGGLFTWTPQPNQSPTNVTVTIVVTNSDPLDTVNPILTATSSFSVTVKEVNIAPVPANIGPQTVNELVTLSVNDAATEPNPHATTTGYGLVNPLPGMSVTSGGLFTWTPQPNQSPTNVTVTIVVTNSDPLDTVNPILTATGSFSVAVKEVNIAPVPANIGPQTVNELVQLTVNDAATESNPHATITGYGLVNPLPGMNVTSGGLFTWTPQPNQSPTNVTVTIVVTNSDPLDTVNPILTATSSFSVTVKEVNIAPVPANIGPQTVNELVQLTVNDAATESNPHATITGYGLVNPLPGMSVTSGGLFTWTPQPNQSPTNVTVTIVVTNSDPLDTVNPILTATSSFSVAVKEVNIAPVLPLINLQTVVVSNVLTVTNTATEPNPHATTTGYGFITAPYGMSISSNGIITWMPGTNEVGVTNLVTTVVTNNDASDLVNPQLATTNSFQVAVVGIHNGPSLPLGRSSITINDLTKLIVTNTATDNDIPLTSLTYQLVNPPTGATIDGNGLITWAPTAAQSSSANTITTVVSDTAAQPLSATNSFTILVDPPVAPPTILSIGITNGSATITWSATVGHTYQVLFEDASGTNWSQVSGNITVTNGTTASVTNSCGGADTRFYRVADTQVTVQQ